MSSLTCKDFLKELTDFLDETTDPETRRQLQEHINECPNCWVVLDTTKKTLQVYKGFEPKPLPEDVRSRLMDAIQRRMKEKAGTSAD